MEFLIVFSTEDKASMNIRNNIMNSKKYSLKELDIIWHENKLFQLESFTKNKALNAILKNNQIYLGLTDEHLIFLTSLKLNKFKINPNLVVFASRHTSKTARPAILIHTTGNWSDDASFGGSPHELSKTSALLQKAGFYCLEEHLKKRSLPEFKFDMEVTHHGPTKVDIPLVFMELGSSKKEWGIKEAGERVGDAIVDTIFKYLSFKEDKTLQIGLGFGGTHYAPNFYKIMRETNIALSFICPKYHIKNLDENLVTQMMQNTIEDIDYFIIDWKGTNSEEKQHLFMILKEFDLPIKKTKDFKSV